MLIKILFRVDVGVKERFENKLAGEKFIELGNVERMGGGELAKRGYV